ncbi:MAG: flavodoxin family protein [Candidatus Bathyarchaeia archaeon]
MAKDAVVVYWSQTGNTAKVAHSIRDGLDDAGLDVSLLKVEEAGELDYFDFDLVCVGFPSHGWHPAKPMDDFLKRNHQKLASEGRVKIGSPRMPGKYALIFCTFSGPHTGINEATPAGDYAGQFFEHIGFEVLDKWYILSEYHGSEERSTQGRMGDIRGLPSEDDLRKIREDSEKIARKIKITFHRGN